MENNQPYKSEKKLIAGILGIILGVFAVHKFYLGYTKEGVIQIIATFVTFGFAGLIGFIEGIIYLTKSDEEFDKTYVEGHKGWF
ncbi:TM2 domain-containing protein [Empedobacter sp.]|uniref:TM2 domain-containing protein n=1 Tax=Empedobacter sp. TaxID=1927715 RepID=UPI0028AB4824|nr:TM2 domain-containing protein [Empedobacter sp.]